MHHGQRGQLRARISEAALEEHFGARYGDPGSHIRAYLSNAEAIHAKAIHLIKLGVWDPCLFSPSICERVRSAERAKSPPDAGWATPQMSSGGGGLCAQNTVVWGQMMGIPACA